MYSSLQIKVTTLELVYHPTFVDQGQLYEQVEGVAMVSPVVPS